MKVLARQFDALDPSVLAFDGVGEDVAPCHPEGVRRVVEPLPVEGPEPGSAEGSRCGQVTVVGRRRRSLGEALPLGEQPLQDLDVGRVRGGRQVLAGGVQVGRAGLPERSWNQETDRPAEAAPGAAAYAEAGTAGSPSATGASPGRRTRGSRASAARRSAACRGSSGPSSSGPSPNVRCGYSRCSRRSSRCRIK